MFADRASSPSSSPPSSPTLCIDSSPASSPTLEPMDLDDQLPPPIHLVHPFAASVKANRAPPLREMRSPARLKAPPPQLSTYSALEPPKKKFRSDRDDPIDVGWMDEPVETISSPSYAYQDHEMAIWDMAITKVVDNGHGAVSLSDQNLTYIPRRISELRNFVAIPETFEQANASRLTTPTTVQGGRLFTRVTTAPPRTSGAFFARSAVSDRTKSIAEASVGLAREQLQLFLSGNQIRSLPRELFDLQKLTVLILRANQLTYLPPEIVRLTNLRELNVSNNKLQYLPSEMSRMTLNQLHLHPNPFLRPPPSRHLSRTISLSPSRRLFTNTSSSASLPYDRSVSQPIHPLPRVLPLVEMASRVLVSHCVFPEPDPVSGESTAPPEANETVLAAHYPLPLEGWDIPQPLKSTLEACVAGAVTDRSMEDVASRQLTPAGEPRVTGISVCPSPRHARRTVFVDHAEERFTWENHVAGANVGGAVPLRWRGCQWGCLDFLDSTTDETEDVNGDTERARMSDDGNDEPEVVQLLHLSLAGGFDDFD